MSDIEEDTLFEGGLFEEPSDFRPKEPENHYVVYKREFAQSENEHGIKEIKLQLVGKSPLWGHLLWNSGIYTGNFIEKNYKEYIKGKKILEFGAASALPSLLSCLNGGDKVICTDYPDAELISNIKTNVENLGFEPANDIIKVLGFIWGSDTKELKEILGSAQDEQFADFLIMSDLVFNHSEHHKLLKSCKELIKPLSGKDQPRSGGKCLVVFSPHRPWLLEDDLKFFQDAKEIFNFDVEHVETMHWPLPMFPEEDKETEEIRRRVYCYMLHPTWC